MAVGTVLEGVGGALTHFGAAGSTAALVGVLTMAGLGIGVWGLLVVLCRKPRTNDADIQI